MKNSVRFVYDVYVTEEYIVALNVLAYEGRIFRAQDVPGGPWAGPGRAISTGRYSS